MTKNQHILYGRHSNIPECCIQFFISEWPGEHARRSPYARAVFDSSYEYVPCPDCFANFFIAKIKDCAKECGRNCALEFQVPLLEEKDLTFERTWDIIK